jgi:hypothetical protein
VVRDWTLRLSHVIDTLLFVVIKGNYFSHSSKQVEKIDIRKTLIQTEFSFLITRLSILPCF